MKRFQCACGQRLFFENTSCVNCGRAVGFDPSARVMRSGERDAEGRIADSTGVFRTCANTTRYGNCNWLLPPGDEHEQCLSCRLNRTIPNLDNPENTRRWSRIEEAKRRLLYTLLELGLPVQRHTGVWQSGLAFDFLEDQRSNPLVSEPFVATGHEQGVITVNVIEADDAQRAEQRELMGETYRTLLGHFRHEAGHYYFNVLVRDSGRLEQFRELFGNEQADYRSALEAHYVNGPPAHWRSRFISAYAASHPQEDWAESFAHFLHITDTLDTAIANGWHPSGETDDFEDHLSAWFELSVVLNELNRSMGLRDAYPFVITNEVRRKLGFVESCI